MPIALEGLAVGEAYADRLSHDRERHRERSCRLRTTRERRAACSVDSLALGSNGLGEKRHPDLPEALLLGMLGVGTAIGLRDLSVALLSEQARKPLPHGSRPTCEASRPHRIVEGGEGALWDADRNLR